MMTVSAAIKSRVNARLAECVAKSGIDTGKITVTYDINSARLGGQANIITNTIRLNPVFLNAYTDHYIETTVAHEWAHLATRKVYGRNVSSHGPEWKRTMVDIGVPPSRCHSYQVPEGVKVGKSHAKHDICCDKCGKDLQCGPKVHANIRNGASYRHKGCGGNIVIVGLAPAVKPIITVQAKPLVKPAVTGSKMEQCMTVYVAMTAAGAPRKEIIEAFVSLIKMTPAGASTYYQNCKKASN